MKSSTKSISKLENEKISLLVDFLMLDTHIDTKQNPLLTKNKVRSKLHEFLSQAKVMDRMKHGFEVMMSDLTSHLGHADLDAVNQELIGSVDQIISMAKEKGTPDDMIPKLQQMPDNLQGILKISENTFTHFYHSGKRFFDAGRFNEASDIFYLLTVLNPFRFNIWIALGLAEIRRHKINEALEAFAFAIMNDLTSIYPHLYSAECYHILKDDAHAKDCLDSAMKVLEEHPMPENQKVKQHIKDLYLKYSHQKK